MKDKAIKLIIVLFTIVFTMRVVTVFIADCLYNMSMAAEKDKIPTSRGIELLNIATKLDSTNANLYFKKYEFLDIQAKKLKGEERYKTYDIRKQQLYLLRQCIQLCPSWSAYHLYYALTLGQMSSRPNIVTKEKILDELKKASELKPYSELYGKIYKSYLKRFLP